MKSKLWNLLAYSLFVCSITSKSYAQMCPFGGCADEPGCNSSITICRPICGEINEEADNYIVEHMRSVSGKQEELSQALRNISSKELEVAKNRESIQFINDCKNQLTEFFHKDLSSKERKKTFLVQLREVLKSSITQKTDYTIAVSQLNIRPVDARILRIFLDAYFMNLEELHNMLLQTPHGNAVSETFNFVYKSLEKQLVKANIENADLRAEMKVLDQQISLIKNQIEEYDQAIAQQQSRKCSSSSF